MPIPSPAPSPILADVDKPGLPCSLTADEPELIDAGVAVTVKTPLVLLVALATVVVADEVLVEVAAELDTEEDVEVEVKGPF